jgi:maltose alpha-D-glucosyltransferase/alpha-amylase
MSEIRHATGEDQNIFHGESRAAVESALPAYMPARRWFGGKARTIRSVEVVEAVPLSGFFLTLVSVSYTEGAPQTYMLPLSFASGQRAEQVRRQTPEAVLAEVKVGAEGVVYDASWDKDFAMALLEAIKEGRRFKGASGDVVAWPMHAGDTPAASSGNGDVGPGILDPGLSSLEPSIMKAEQSNTSIAYGDRLILKLFRRLEEGTSPELEVGRFLVEKGFANTPPLAGAIEHHRGAKEPITLAVLQRFVPNQGDAWRYTLDSLARYFDTGWDPMSSGDLLPRGHHLLAMQEEEVPQPVRDAIGPYLESARLLGRRTAEMHLTLASDPANPAFAPEPFDAHYRWFIYESMRDLTAHAFLLLNNNLASLPDEARSEVEATAGRQDEVMARFRPLIEQELAAVRTRCHGDFHLGQILYTGSDFMIIDFEGEPVRSLEERRRKHSPLKDVAGMLRSFHYAAASALQAHVSKELDRGGDPLLAEQRADAWYLWVSATYLKEYLAVTSKASFLPQARDELQVLLDAHLLEKAVYELIYELNNRPSWVRIPLRGVKQIMGFQD